MLWYVSYVSWQLYQDTIRVHSVYAPSQWEMTLHCKVISHWLGTYTKWSLHNMVFEVVVSLILSVIYLAFNTLRLRQDARHFSDSIFICIFLNENEWHSIKISLKFVPKVPINNIPALVQIMAWRRPGDKPLSEPIMVSLLMHIRVTQPQWVNTFINEQITPSCRQ